MPQIIKTIDEIMEREKRDMFFLSFDPFAHDPSHPEWQRHLEWLAANNVRFCIAAPRGWLDGNPGSYAIFFDGPDDPRIATYSAEFEQADGKSLDPDVYQMWIKTYQSWLSNPKPPDDKDW